MLHCLGATDNSILSEFMSAMSTAYAYLLVIFGFSVVVFIHELGHFAAAKWAGVRVQAFAIGFGRRLMAYRKGIGFRFGSTDGEYRRRVDEVLVSRGIATRDELSNPEGPTFESERAAAGREMGISETEYRFNILPLGGYVQMLGQEDFVVDKTGELKVKADPDSFTNKPVGKRMVIVSAGVIMNLIFAAILFTIVNMVGMPQLSPVLGYVVENTPAGRAGLLPGDRILEINGDEIANFNDLMMRITLSDPDETLTMRVERDGKIVSPSPEIRPEFVEEREVRQIGVAPGETRRVWGVTFGDISAARPDELHEKDEIHSIIVDGHEVECRDAGVVRREMMRAEGRPIELVVKRPKHPESLTDADLKQFDPPIETETHRVKVSAMWLPLPYDSNDRGGASLLGLVPRLTVIQSNPGKSFDKAGVKAGDVIVRIGSDEYPTYSEFVSAIQKAGTGGLEIEVRRKGSVREGLSAAVVSFCVAQRERLIRAGIEDLNGARDVLADLARGAGIDEAGLVALNKALAEVKTVDAWRKWFEKVDVITLGPIKPKAPFALFSRPAPTIDADVRNIDEDHLLVADVIPKFGDRLTPAQASGLERGAVILSVNDKPVRRWYELSHAFAANAGKAVEIEYRLVNKIARASFVVPASVQTSLGLGAEDRVAKIADKSQCVVRVADSLGGGFREVSLSLPDWRAIEALLKDNIGRTVPVEYVTASGERKTGEYAVTADNTDPWPSRVQYYAMTFFCFPLVEWQSTPDPFKAFIAGVKQAHHATMSTIKTIRHMLFTRTVGVSNVSGPLGIAHKGSEVAQGGMIALFWFLGLISANLAVINFLPLPIVDGGLFLFLILEKIRGEPVSIKTQVATQLLGIALIATVFILVTYQDILRLVTGA